MKVMKVILITFFAIFLAECASCPNPPMVSQSSDALQIDEPEVKESQPKDFCTCIESFSYRGIVDCNLGFYEMLETGNFDWRDVDINEKNFPLETCTTKEVEFKLVDFNNVPSEDEILAELDKLGLRPATLRELVHIAAVKPDLQREFSIIALGSQWHKKELNRIIYPELHTYHDEEVWERLLNESHHFSRTGTISKETRFLAVGKTIDESEPKAEQEYPVCNVTFHCDYKDPTLDAFSIDTFTVTLDYSMTFKEMVSAGRYDSANTMFEITKKNFPINKRESGKVELDVIHFGRKMTREQVLDEFEKRGLRSAELPELMALGAHYPGLQKKRTLVAAGPQARKSTTAAVGTPVLSGNKKERKIHLIWSMPSPSWNKSYSFVAVRK